MAESRESSGSKRRKGKAASDPHASPVMDHVAERENDDEELVAGVDPELLRVEIDETKARRFYDRIRHNILRYVEQRGVRLGKTANYLLLAPDVFILLFRLSLDPRVGGKNKALLATGIGYFIFPLDLMPEALFGPIGFLDDLVLAVYILNRVLRDTDPAILREHWSGEGDVLAMIRNVLAAAETLVSTKLVNRIKKFVR